MEINKCSSAVNMYKKIGSDYKSVSKSNSKTIISGAKNVDKVEISSAARENNLESVKSTIKKNVDNSASSDRIAALKAKIADGTYSISPENVAAAIFEG